MQSACYSVLRRAATAILLVIACCVGGCAPGVEATQVTLLRTPDGGIQPQAALAANGVLHLIYFKGEPLGGDIFYVRRAPGQDTFSAPIRVNSQAGSAVATGTVRGAQLAIGKDNSLHVAWNGSGSATPKGPGGNPMLYSRLNPDGTAFEPQRNLVTRAGGLDGGGTIAADAQGRVYVSWHADPEERGEAERAVYLARSSDNGATFEREKRINDQPTGACGCCAMRAFVDDKGAVYILYRAAGGGADRDMTLLVSNDHGATFRSGTVHKWNIGTCPMSSAAFAQNGDKILMAWETREQVYFTGMRPSVAKRDSQQPLAAPGAAEGRKHPVLAANAAGETLLAWTEGTGWMRGGSLAWQIYDKAGKPTAHKGRSGGVPVWSLLAAFTQPDGDFVLVY
ncbi:MAG TPA: sialidase family protein [Abditibacteriaceae bacterium]|nr:sialidase family protein [Abditibacteriaceae bacterium]